MNNLTLCHVKQDLQFLYELWQCCIIQIWLNYTGTIMIIVLPIPKWFVYFIDFQLSTEIIHAMLHTPTMYVHVHRADIILAVIAVRDIGSLIWHDDAVTCFSPIDIIAFIYQLCCQEFAIVSYYYCPDAARSRNISVKITLDISGSPISMRLPEISRVILHLCRNYNIQLKWAGYHYFQLTHEVQMIILYIKKSHLRMADPAAA